MSDLLQKVRDGSAPAFEIFDNGKRYRIFVNGNVEVEQDYSVPGFIIINRLPFLTKEAA